MCKAWSPLLPPWPMWRLLEGSQLDAAALLTFAVDGDNTIDAMQLASCTARLLRQTVEVAGLSQHMHWRQPRSWAGMYGRHTAAIS